MLAANTYPPVPVVTGLLGTALSSPPRPIVGLKLTAQRKQAADQKLLSVADTGLWQQLGKAVLEAYVTVKLLLYHVNWEVLCSTRFHPRGYSTH